MTELVSVVIPTYNYGRFVTEAVASVLAQTYREVEVIVVDDGSTDNTRERLAPFMDRIRYIHQANQGLSAARNAGIQAARGRWVALLDSDDAWHPRKLEMQLAYLDTHVDVALLGTASTFDFGTSWPDIDPLADRTAVPVTLADVVFTTHFAPSSVVMRKECFERVGLFDPELRSAEDRDMWIRVACHYQMARLDLPLCGYRFHGSNMVTVADRMEVNELKMLRKAFAGISLLRRRRLLRFKTFSYAYYNATYRYSASRKWLKALDRFLRSFALWPMPYRRGEVDRSLARPRMLVVLLLRMLRLKQPETAAHVAT
ncbi:MAG: glycosyltransferase family 2 protein [Gemmataceae bacterium]